MRRALSLKRFLDVFKLISITNFILISSVVLVVLVLFATSLPIVLRDGVSPLIHSIWNPVSEEYGFLFALGGTVVTASLALAISLALSIGLAAVYAEYIPDKLRPVVKNFMDLAASIPSVIYGLWGLKVLSPVLRSYVMEPLVSLGLSPYLGHPSPTGTSLFSAAVLLAVMVTPLSSSIIRERLVSIPMHIREALYSLGLMKTEVVLLELKYIRRSILTAMAVSYSRAVGETAAVAMVVGNVVNPYFFKIFRPGYTISSLIADQYPNAEAYYYMVPALFYAALVLFFISLAVNFLLLKSGERT
ncbi:MAG: phosphate ABC transporter permease subunit PstC [Sulfolobales archaeon]|nr:phosphate ABC transporter permease subunit PstC [Sulfolobales archaeon]MCX8208601.1 phosphate ABC transporter permease subunit PstC [Sulfolobales archaeon]MDW8011324.1 phosphate ABC transporter permease subunit PstC [Sulfolobales archaeon]